jgi:hypothetical protein
MKKESTMDHFILVSFDEGKIDLSTARGRFLTEVVVRIYNFRRGISMDEDVKGYLTSTTD